jgi:hypothetical protein
MLSENINSYNYIFTKLLPLTGGAIVGQITGVTTLNGTTGIYGTLATTNNTNVAVPSVGVAGGIGDKIILCAGTGSVHPYYLGINSSTFRYSVPSGASHKFYVNDSPITTIDSAGIITTSLINVSTFKSIRASVMTPASVTDDSSQCD